MGYFWPGLPPYMLAWARASLGPSAHFVETGTFRGDTAATAARFFSVVDTIELDPVLGRRARERFQHSRVRCHIGDSRQVLPTILPELETPLILWLDAHFSGGVTGGANDPCPLITELRIVDQHRDCSNTIVAVDDARCFTGSRGFPRLDAVAAVLGQRWAWNIIDDVLWPRIRSLSPIFSTPVMSGERSVRAHFPGCGLEYTWRVGYEAGRRPVSRRVCSVLFGSRFAEGLEVQSRGTLCWVVFIRG